MSLKVLTSIWVGDILPSMRKKINLASDFYSTILNSGRQQNNIYKMLKGEGCPPGYLSCMKARKDTLKN